MRKENQRHIVGTLRFLILFLVLSIIISYTVSLNELKIWNSTAKIRQNGHVVFEVRLKDSLNSKVFALVDDKAFLMTKVADSIYRLNLSLSPGVHEYSFKAYNLMFKDLTLPGAINITEYMEHNEEPRWRFSHLPISDQRYQNSIVRISVEVQRKEKPQAVWLHYELDGSEEYSTKMNRQYNRTYSRQMTIVGPKNMSYRFEAKGSDGYSQLFPSEENFNFRNGIMLSKSNIPNFIESHRKSDGGYGAIYGDESDISYTFWAIKMADILGNDLEYSNSTKEYLLKLDPRKMSIEKLYYLSASMVNYRLGNISNKIARILSSKKRPNGVYTSDPQKYHGYQSVESTYYAIAALKSLDPTNKFVGNEKLLIYTLLKRQNRDGGFGEAIGKHVGRESYLGSTYYCVYLLTTLEKNVPNPHQLINWILDCQNKDGGFGIQPGEKSDIWPTFLATKTLQLMGWLNHSSLDVDNLAAFVRACRNRDGGFGDIPGLPSRLEASYFSLEILSLIGEDIPENVAGLHEPTSTLVEGLEIYSFQSGAAGGAWGHIDPVPMVAKLYDYIGLDVVGIKTSNMTFISELNQYSKQHHFDILFFPSPEKYGISFYMEGLGYVNKIGNILYNPNSILEKEKLPDLPDNQEWEIFSDRINNLHKEGNIIAFGGGPSRELDYLVFGDPIGYDALIAAGLNGNNLVKNPHLERFVGSVPLITDSDAHKDIWSWAGREFVLRTLFLSSNNSWAGFCRAVELNRMATITLNSQGSFSLWGRPKIVGEIIKRMDEWVWWNTGKRTTNGDKVIQSSALPDIFAYLSCEACGKNKEQNNAYFSNDISQRDSIKTSVMIWWLRGVRLIDVQVNGKTIDTKLVSGSENISPYLRSQFQTSSKGPYIVEISYLKDSILVKECFHFDCA